MSEASTIYSETKNASQNKLFKEYNWFYEKFLPIVQTACDEFFSDLFYLKLVGVSKNINVLFSGSDYFVTKIRIDRQHDIFIRSSQDCLKIIFEEVLGKSDKRFDISQITELEAKIVSSFNDYLYNNFAPLLLVPEKGKKRKNFDTINLTFFLKKHSMDEGGKIIISIPESLVSPEQVMTSEEKFDVSDFNQSEVEVKIKVGTTKFPVKDLKLLEREDLVIFDNSNIQLMQIQYEDFEKTFRINPNPGLITPIENNYGGNNMEETALSQNLWDNIQVEMGAEFDKVKISLGELKNIEQGLVVDISSVYNNKISLKVENKVIARGELVIVDDRYGVRIDEIFTSDKSSSQEVYQQESHMEDELPDALPETQENMEDEFDYSDFELDDQDI